MIKINSKRPIDVVQAELKKEAEEKQRLIDENNMLKQKIDILESMLIDLTDKIYESVQ